MKSIKKISTLVLAIAALLTVSCENEKLIFEGPYFVRFTDDALTQKESHIPEIKIQVHNAGPAPESDLTINYSISGSAREGIDYNIIGTRGKVKIKSGEYFGDITVQLINNSNNIIESQDVVFTLITVEKDDSGLQIGEGPSQIGRSFTLTITDDCILGGDYYGITADIQVPIENITITSDDCKTYILSNYDIYIFTFSAIRSLKITDNGDNTITIPQQKDVTLPDGQQTIDGSGVVDPTTRIITITVRLVDFDDQPEATFQLIPY